MIKATKRRLPRPLETSLRRPAASPWSRAGVGHRRSFAHRFLQTRIKNPCHRPPPSRDQLINKDFTLYRVTSTGRCSYLGFSSRWHGH